MTSRERVKAAVEFTGPDKIPFIHCYLPVAMREYEGLPVLLQKYPSDIAGEGNTSLNNPLYKQGTWTDEWGCVWTVLRDGIMGQVTVHPLADDADFTGYKWPNARETDISEDIAAVKDRGEKYTRVGWLTLFERMIDLRGFEETMIDIYSGSETFYEVRDNILQYNMDLLDRLTELGADCIAFADDWGSQLNMLISPDLWEKYFLPVYRKMFEKVRAKGMHVFFHTDGYTMPILPKLVEAGVDIFWADMTVNPPEQLAKELGGKVCFQALTDVQYTLLHASVDGVRAYIKKLIMLFGNFNGGLIGCSEIDPDQPWENVVVAYKTFNECGVYPLAE
jgi:hypothetical protein